MSLTFREINGRIFIGSAIPTGPWIYGSDFKMVVAVEMVGGWAVARLVSGMGRGGGRGGEKPCSTSDTRKYPGLHPSLSSLTVPQVQTFPLPLLSSQHCLHISTLNNRLLDFSVGQKNLLSIVNCVSDKAGREETRHIIFIYSLPCCPI